MTPEESNELKELVAFLKENNIGEFEFERGEIRIRIRFGNPPASTLDVSQITQLLAARTGAGAIAAASPASPPAAGPESGADSGSEEGLHIVKSPIVGTFYESPSPGAPPFVKIGDEVENGQVLCIIEAMKLMNEIESDAAGVIVKRYVSGGQPVEYGQPLFSVKPN